MKIRRHSILPIVTFVFVAAATFSFFAAKDIDTTSAVSAANFMPGNIISDYVMGNYNSMTEAEIQTFLSSHGNCNFTEVWRASAGNNDPSSFHVKDGHFVCLADETFGEGIVYGDAAPNGQTAAHIIWQAAQDFKINPQVLIVLLEKEQGLITDSWPNRFQYRSATGYGCPDTAACDTKYYGFENQVRNAAWMFRSVLDGGWTNYPLGENYIQYNPNPDCGGSVVNVENLATSALYRYTPYQPNAGALAAGFGTAYCGAYGNRNFYLYFTDWFGNIIQTETTIPDAFSEIVTNYETLLGVIVNHPTQESDGRIWQTFENGTIIYHPDTGANAVLNGPISKKWAEMGGSLGQIGKPKNSTTQESDGRIWQTFENGTIIYHPDTGANAVLNGPISKKWAEMGGSLGQIGKPKNSTTQESDGRIWQTFENGTIIYHPDTGANAVLNGPISKKWAVVGGSLGVLGAPAKAADSKDDWSWQDFANGGIIYLSGTEQAISLQDKYLYQGWKQAISDDIYELGYPITMQFIEPDGRHWQTFENGTIIYHPDTGAWAMINGPIHEEWAKSGGSLGPYGRPISNLHDAEDAISQQFLNGTIVIPKVEE